MIDRLETLAGRLRLGWSIEITLAVVVAALLLNACAHDPRTDKVCVVAGTWVHCPPPITRG